MPNACGLSLVRAQARAGRALAEGLPALGLHRRSGIDQALDVGGMTWIFRRFGLEGVISDAHGVLGASDDDPRLQGRIRMLGPVWGADREDLLDQVGAWLCLYPLDEDSPERLCPLQVADAAGSGCSRCERSPKRSTSP